MSPAPAWHCQVCGRQIGAKRGLIAHHGFTRPRDGGWQTGSCPGARFRPYEVASDALPPAIEAAKAGAERLEAQAERISVEKLPVPARTGRVLSGPDRYTTRILEPEIEATSPNYPRRAQAWIAGIRAEARHAREAEAFLRERLAAWRAPAPDLSRDAAK